MARSAPAATTARLPQSSCSSPLITRLPARCPTGTCIFVPALLFCLLCPQWRSATAIEAPQRGWVASGDANADARHDTLTGHWAAQDAHSGSGSIGGVTSGGGGGGSSIGSVTSGGGSGGGCGDLSGAVRLATVLQDPPRLQPLLLSEATLAAHPAAGRWLADLQRRADRGGL